MNEVNAFYFLKMSGLIAANKEKEFEQTVRFVFNQLPPDCFEKVLSSDIHKKDHYLIYAVFSNERSLKNFLVSIEFQLIKGAFDTLGQLEKTAYGTCVEKQEIARNGLN